MHEGRVRAGEAGVGCMRGEFMQARRVWGERSCR